MMIVCTFFFFSSRRRHTRSKRDWSSDVCSSDLRHDASIAGKEVRSRFFRCGCDVSEGVHTDLELLRCMTGLSSRLAVKIDQRRSEERRVGKEWRSRGWAWREKKKKKRVRI